MNISMDPADETRQDLDRDPRVRFAIVKSLLMESRREDFFRARSSGTGKSTYKRGDTGRPRCANGGGSLSSLMVTATDCKAETARG